MLTFLFSEEIGFKDLFHCIIPVWSIALSISSNVLGLCATCIYSIYNYHIHTYA